MTLETCTALVQGAPLLWQLYIIILRAGDAVIVCKSCCFRPVRCSRTYWPDIALVGFTLFAGHVNQIFESGWRLRLKMCNSIISHIKAPRDAITSTPSVRLGERMDRLE